MPVLEKGCFCCDLTTCVKVQAFGLTAVFVLISILDLLLLALWVLPREQDPDPSVDEFGRRFISNTKVVCLVLLVCFLVWVLLGVLLLYGIYKKQRWLFWPYMVLGTANLFITAGLLIFYASSVNAQIPNMVILVLLLALQVYLLLHIVSLFQKMGVEEQQAGYEQQAVYEQQVGYEQQ